MKRTPPEWKILRIDQIGTVQGGRQRSPHKIKGILVPYLRVANVLDGYIDYSDVLSMVFTQSELETFSLRQGDVLLNEGQSIDLVGRSAIYTGTIPNLCFQNTLIRFRALPETDSSFAQKLFAFLQKSGKLSAIASRTTSIAHLGVNRFAQLKVPVPTYSEQVQIASLLDTWDLAIEQMENVIAVKQRRKKALMQQLLTGKRRFLEFRKTRWHRFSLGEVIQERTIRNSDLKLSDVRAVNKMHGMIPMKAEVIGQSLDRYKIVEPKDFAYNPMRVNIGSICRWEGDENCLVSPDYVVFRAIDGKLDSDYLAHFQKSYRWQKFMDRAGAGGVRIRIYYSDLAEMTISLPPTLAEQRKIAAVLNTANEEINQLKTQLAALRRQKQGLMQVLLTGKVRLVKEEVSA